MKENGKYFQYAVIISVLIFIHSGISFAQSPSLIYGPYLQRGGQTNMDVCWRTTVATDSKLKFGLSKFNLNQVIFNGTQEILHRISIGGLAPNTKYFYAVTNAAGTFSTDTFYFYTAPAQGSQQKIRFAVTGDCGTQMQTQLNTKAALMHHFKNEYVNGWLILGDNAYTDGTDAEYTNKFFLPYQNNWLMQQTCLYPATGNHDYANNAVNAEQKNVPYFDLFYLPAGGELGGLASGTEAYYSYNYGNIHFISIDSYGTETALRVFDTLSPQYQWVKQDLAANNSMWTIVYFHHPPYTMGSHNSDTEGELVNMRKYVTPLFEKYRVDLVLSGHSHNYERSKLIKGHQGYELEFDPSLHVKDSSSGKYDGSQNSCAYVKDSISNKGVIYAVCGSSGWTGATQASYPHEALPFSYSLKGIAGIIETSGNRLDAKFISEDSLIRDRFTIFRNVKKKKTLWYTSGQTFTLSASWNGNYVWSHDNSTGKQSVFSPVNNSVIYVRDSLNCIRDTFELSFGTGIEEMKGKSMLVWPNPATEQITVNGLPEGERPIEAYFTDMAGRKYFISEHDQDNDEMRIIVPQGLIGECILRVRYRDKSIEQKIIIK